MTRFVLSCVFALCTLSIEGVVAARNFSSEECAGVISALATHRQPLAEVRDRFRGFRQSVLEVSDPWNNLEQIQARGRNDDSFTEAQRSVLAGRIFEVETQMEKRDLPEGRRIIGATFTGREIDVFLKEIERDQKRFEDLKDFAWNWWWTPSMMSMILSQSLPMVALGVYISMYHSLSAGLPGVSFGLPAVLVSKNFVFRALPNLFRSFARQSPELIDNSRSSNWVYRSANLKLARKAASESYLGTSTRLGPSAEYKRLFLPDFLVSLVERLGSFLPGPGPAVGDPLPSYINLDSLWRKGATPEEDKLTILLRLDTTEPQLPSAPRKNVLEHLRERFAQPQLRLAPIRVR